MTSSTVERSTDVPSPRRRAPRRNGIDLALLDSSAHSASFATVSRSAGADADVVDFCIPCNPYFPTPEMFERLGADLPSLLKYYPSDSAVITKRLCALLGLHPQTVAMANGSTELITWIDHLLVSDSIAVPIPTFGRWTDQPLETGKRVDMFVLREDQGFALDLAEYSRFLADRGSKVAVVCNPNNPDGGYVRREELLRFLDEHAHLDLIVVDESFIDFVDVDEQCSVADQAAIRPNVIVLKSLGKNFGLHGIRFGYLVASPALARRIGEALPKWNVNALAERVIDLLSDFDSEYDESLRALAADRDHMTHVLEQVPDLRVYRSRANFVLVRLPAGWSGTGLRDHLVAHHGVFIRECGNKLGMTSDFVRLVVRPAADVDRLVEGLSSYAQLQSRRTRRPA